MKLLTATEWVFKSEFDLSGDTLKFYLNLVITFIKKTSREVTDRPVRRTNRINPIIDLLHITTYFKLAAWQKGSCIPTNEKHKFLRHLTHKNDLVSYQF